MRHLRLSAADVEGVIAKPGDPSFDDRGNVRLMGETADKRRIVVVVASDDPEVVVTVFERSRA